MIQIDEGATPLMYACQQGRDKDILDILAKKPRAARARDRTLKTPLHYCAETQRIECAEAILRVAPEMLDARDEDGYTTLHLAVISGNKVLLRLLLDRGADVNTVDNELHSAVHWATVCGEVEALEMILNAGADMATADIHGGYPLHYAAQMCGPGVDMMGNKEGLAVLKTLLAYGSNVNVTDKEGRQPILWAASADSQSRDPSARFTSSGSADAILALVNSGASVEAADKDGLTALHCAASRGHTDCLETLVTLCGANVNVIDSNGCTALFYAVTLGHADSAQLLLNLDSEPNRQDRKGRTPAHCGAAKGQLETLKILSNFGANLWLRNVRGDFPLHEAVASGRKDLVVWLLQMRPEAVNVANNDGRCPIHVAAINNNIDMIQILLDHHSLVNPIMRSSKGQMMTPIDVALHRGNRSCAKYLQVQGGVPYVKLTDKTVGLVGGNGDRPRRTNIVSERSDVIATTGTQSARDSCYSTLPLPSDTTARSLPEVTSVRVNDNDNMNETSREEELDLPSTGHRQADDTSEDDRAYHKKRRRRKSDQRRQEYDEESGDTEEEKIKERTKFRRKSDKKKDTSEDDDKRTRRKKDKEESGEEKNKGRKKDSGESDYELSENGGKVVVGKEHSSESITSDNGRLEEDSKQKTELEEEDEKQRKKVEFDLEEDVKEEVKKLEEVASADEMVEVREQKELTQAPVPQTINGDEKVKEEDEAVQREADQVELETEHLGSPPMTSPPLVQREVVDGAEREEEQEPEVEEAQELEVEAEQEQEEEEGENAGEDSETNLPQRRLSLRRDESFTEDFEKDDEICDADLSVKEVRIGEADGRSTSMGDESGGSTRNDSSIILDSGIEPSPRRRHPGTSRVARLCRKDKTEDDGLENTISVTQAVQNTIRKYHQERSIFYQLLELKRLQIRAGRVNEQVLVKRMLDDYRRSGLNIGLTPYNGSYSFKEFESYLYAQLHSLQSTGQRIMPKILPSDDLEKLSSMLKKSRTQLLENIQMNPILCTHSTHRCPHAAHAYTGIPCAAYITKLNHHQMPKDTTRTGFLPRIDPLSTHRPGSKKCSMKPVTLEFTHGPEKQVISLPTDRLDKSKRYYVTFTIKGVPTPPTEQQTSEDSSRHRHAKSF